MKSPKSLAIFPIILALGFTSANSAEVTELLDERTVKWNSSSVSLGPLRKFYKLRRGKGVWTDEKGLSALGEELVGVLNDAGKDGLFSSRYIRKLPKEFSKEELPNVELYLSQAFWRFGKDLYGGRTTSAISASDIVINRKKYDIDGWLSKASRRGPKIVIEELRPPHAQYHLLKEKLAKSKKKAMRRKIRANMERWRWLPRDMGRRHVMVNQAAYLMFIRENGKIVDRRKVIVGKPKYKTPMFSHTISYAEFNPTWTVSRSIAAEEYLPRLRRNSRYFEKRDYKIYESWEEDAAELDTKKVNWRKVSGKDFPYRIVQSPGKKNALGKVKFMFPNRFKVYLHDTPHKRLFKNRGRAYSHGCIRVEKPLEFANRLFKPQGLSDSKIQKILQNEDTTKVNVRRKIPIHLTYFTTWVDEKGKLKSYKDIYGRDRMVSRLLAGEG